METAVEWLFAHLLPFLPFSDPKEREHLRRCLSEAKEMEKNNIDNKVIHFAEWLTKKHTSTLITLYEHFEEEYYNETFKSE